MDIRRAMAKASLACGVVLFSTAPTTPTSLPAPTTFAHHMVSTSDPQAQAAFDQGLLDYYAYNPEAAEHEFYTAADLDPHLAMAYWGIAMSNASNLNVASTDDREQQGQAAISQAHDLYQYASASERAYIDAAAQRFSSDPKAKQAALLLKYRDAMRRVSQKYPADADAAALYGEASLYVFADDIANDKGSLSDAQRTAYAARMATLLPYFQRELALFPKHVGLLHFYMHAADEANQQASALAAAQTLAAISLPVTASHLTHMPGHIFLKTGRYDQALDVAKRSVVMDYAELECCHPGYYSAMRYYHDHNVAFLMVALTELGDTAEALHVAERDGFPYFIARQLVASEDWGDLVRMQPKALSQTIAFARGLGYAGLHDIAATRDTLRTMPKASNDDASWKATVEAMKLILQARVAEEEHDDAGAVPLLQQACAAADRGDEIDVAEFPALYYYSPHLALARLAERLHDRELEIQALHGELQSAPNSPAALRALADLRETK